ncbi:mucin-7-like [Seriola lalandi dorsalis]|uniref:mucin-7-like n=1 Tax=Seriola lalandi dorsalis TaxID=1841481 RepID=UPI000C6F8F21|nr:mucin-7-like [Seriola lalandi dorsalis]XP_056233636.1 endomucin-like [Seriola aureovittata]
MPAAMQLIVLVSLFAVTACRAQPPASATNAEHHTNLTVRTKNDVISSTVKTTNTSQQTTPHQISTTVTSEKMSSSPPLSSTSPQTPSKTKETNPSRPPETTKTNKTLDETVSPRSTPPQASGSPNVTATTTVNTTSPALSHDQGKGDLATNPGLVAIICIFCIILGLVLVVASVKCVRSSRSNFERLDDVPMGKVNEHSPFAQYTK